MRPNEMWSSWKPKGNGFRIDGLSAENVTRAVTRMSWLPMTSLSIVQPSFTATFGAYKDHLTEYNMMRFY